MRNCLNCPDKTIRKCASKGILKSMVNVFGGDILGVLRYRCTYYTFLEEKK
jgi:hypothetical protein